ncbi:hypothetical protein F5888DRAFT_72856 [Russula emetica]|nr:hypothetical protein F5888DRAFT_72856 [Russula emetica]
MEVFKEITSECFLSKLLAYRREFLHVGVLFASIKGALVSCADVILANIAMTSVCIASDTVDMDGMTHTLARREEDEAVLASSQLPYTWTEMLDLLTSNITSCTALRLSLRLIFAAYVLHPQLSGTQARVDTFTPSWLTKVLRTYMSRIFPTVSVVHEYNGDDAPEWSLRDRAVFAMILVLFSVTKQTNNSIVPTPHEFPYVFPQEILHIIRAIIYSGPRVTFESALFPFTHPDGAQMVLLSWGQVVPWSWTIWNDTRLADMELITPLTAVWICHADALCMRMRSMRHHNWQRVLLRASKLSPSDAAIAVTELLKLMVTLSSLHESTMWPNLLFRTIWWTAQLLHPCHPWYIKATPVLIRSICCILVECMTEGVSLEAQEALFEALTHVDADELRVAIQTLEVDKQSRFLPKLDNAIDVLQKAVSAAEGCAPLTQDMIRRMGLAMSFLTLCCKTSPRFCCGISVSALLSKVAKYASRMDTSYLSCHLLTLLSSLGNSRGHIPANKSLNIGFDKIPWEIALSRPRSDMPMASCLASCVLSREQLRGLHTSTAIEIWDYLRNVLLLILTGHYTGDEAPLGCLVAPTICEGLLALLRKGGDPLVTWALCSPWSKSLYGELRTLLESNENTLSKTQIILRKRLSLGGKSLMEKLANENGRLEEQIEGENGVMTYVYFKGNIVPVVGKWREE